MGMVSISISMQPVEPVARHICVWSAADASFEARESAAQELLRGKACGERHSIPRRGLVSVGRPNATAGRVVVL